MKNINYNFLFLKALACFLGLEALGSFLGPSPLLWLQMTWALDPASWQRYDQVLEYSFEQRVMLCQDQALSPKPSELEIPEAGHCFPVLIAAHFENQLNYWVYSLTQKSLEEHAIVLGEKGIIGRLGKRQGALYPVEPLDTKGFNIALVSDPQQLPSVFTGHQGRLIGYDLEQIYEVGMTLYTMPQERFYPQFFPVARVQSLRTTTDGIEVTAVLNDDLSSYQFARVYVPPDDFLGDK